jgi:hypothetical protein
MFGEASASWYDERAVTRPAIYIFEGNAGASFECGILPV